MAKKTMASVELEKKMKELTKKAVYVGVSEQSMGYQYPTGQSLGQVAMEMNYGTSRVPARNFVQLPLKIKKEQLKAIQKKALKANLPAEKALAFIGEAGRNIILDAFDSGGFGTWEPLSLYTVEKKGSTSILVDTGVLKGSIGYKIK